jgi:hypothetical protein
MLRGRVGELAALLDPNPSMIHRRYRPALNSFWLLAPTQGTTFP